MDIGQTLLQILTVRNCSVYRFAHDAGMSRSQLYKILQDNHSPTLLTLERIGRALDMSVSEFISLVEMADEEPAYNP